MAAKTTTMEGALSFSVADVVEDVLQQQGNRHNGLDLESKEAASIRFILELYPRCQLHPRVVESPCDSALVPDGAALSAFQYSENVRNFLVAVQEMGIPTFEASDLEQPTNCSLSMLVRAILLDKKPEEVPMLFTISKDIGDSVRILVKHRQKIHLTLILKMTMRKTSLTTVILRCILLHIRQIVEVA